MSAENAWRIAMGAAAEWLSALHGRPGQKDADAHDAAVKEARQLLRSLPMPPAFRAEVEAEADKLREMLRKALDAGNYLLTIADRNERGSKSDAAAYLFQEIDALLSSLEAKGESHE